LLALGILLHMLRIQYILLRRLRIFRRLLVLVLELGKLLRKLHKLYISHNQFYMP
jgi:hypothetical protein